MNKKEKIKIAKIIANYYLTADILNSGKFDNNFKLLKWAEKLKKKVIYKMEKNKLIIDKLLSQKYFKFITNNYNYNLIDKETKKINIYSKSIIYY